MRIIALTSLLLVFVTAGICQNSSVEGYTLNLKSLHNDTLIRHCGNKLEFSIPELGAKFEPYFMVMGGTFRLGMNKGEVTVIPDNSKVMVKVYNRSTYIGQHIFIVEKAPSPKLEVFDEKKPVTQGSSISVSDLGHLDLKVKPEPTFAAEFPKDSKYKVTKFDVSLIRDGKEVEHMHFDKFHGNISHWKSKAHKGDQLHIEIKEVMRKTIMHKSEKVYNIERDMIFANG